MKVKSCPNLFVTPWTVAHHAPLSVGFSRQEYWSELPCSPPGDLPHPGIKPRSPVLQADSLSAESQGKPFYSFTEHLSFIEKGGDALLRMISRPFTNLEGWSDVSE